MGSDEPKKCDGAGARRFSVKASDAVFHPPRPQPASQPLQPPCRPRRVAGLRDRPPRRHGAVLGFSPYPRSARLQHHKNRRGTKPPCRVHCSKRPPEAAGLAEPAGSPGVLSDPAQPRPRRGLSHSSAGKATSTRPSGPKSATIRAPRLVNTMPVHDPVVTKVPAFAPPRPFIRLAKSTSAAMGSRAAPAALSAKGSPSSVIVILVWPRSSFSQSGTAAPYTSPPFEKLSARIESRSSERKSA